MKSRRRTDLEANEVDGTTSKTASPNPSTNSTSSTGATRQPTTTTMDPMEAFCQEACVEGYGGPECDCPEHPIG